MAVVGRYRWGKTEQGYGWNLWEGCGLAIEKDGKTGYWSVYEKDGSLLCQCVTYRDAQRVAARIRKLALAPLALPQAGILSESKKGWTWNTIDHIEDYGKTFATREETEAHIKKRPLPTTSPLLLSMIGGTPPTH